MVVGGCAPVVVDVPGNWAPAAEPAETKPTVTRTTMVTATNTRDLPAVRDVLMKSMTPQWPCVRGAR